MFVVLVYSYTMFDELMRLPDEVRKKKSTEIGRHLRGLGNERKSKNAS